MATDLISYLLEEERAEWEQEKASLEQEKATLEQERLIATDLLEEERAKWEQEKATLEQKKATLEQELATQSVSLQEALVRQTLQQGVEDVLIARFPHVPITVVRDIRQITDLTQLQHLPGVLAQAPDMQSALHLLRVQSN